MLTPINPITNWMDRPPLQQGILVKQQVNHKNAQVEFYNRLYECYVRCATDATPDEDVTKHSCNTFALYG